MYRLSDFDFNLPVDLIAQYPASERSASRLLIVGSHFRDAQFTDILDLINPGDVVIFNKSKVIPARCFGVKTTGGQVEVLVERIVSEFEARVLLRVSKKPAAGAKIVLRKSTPLSDTDKIASGNKSPESVNDCALEFSCEVLGRDAEHDDRFLLRFSAPVLEVLESCGEIPLPPYIAHKPTENDQERYQTVYAETPGSVAAPTAGLHFDAALMSALKEKGVRCGFVTLHVGTGTFAPVREENLEAHRMHSEWCEIPVETASLIKEARLSNRRVIAVGTTSLRTLESGSVAESGSRGLVRSGSWETDIFIRPGYSFQVVDALLTNFHLPKSTLLMLVAAFVGYDTMRSVYQHAIKSRYRFFSYGDAMFCSRSAS